MGDSTPVNQKFAIAIVNFFISYRNYDEFMLQISQHLKFLHLNILFENVNLFLWEKLSKLEKKIGNSNWIKIGNSKLYLLREIFQFK